jgi:putative DNA primase/helicase
MLTFTPVAKASWVVFHDVLEGELRSGGELYDVRDVASKTADNAARLAALFHIFTHRMGGPVDKDSFDGASQIAAWHLSEARRFFAELALPVEQVKAVRLDAWLIEYANRKQVGFISRREAQRSGPVRDKEALKQALQELDELSRARLVIDGRRKDIFINPALLAGGEK